MIVAVDGTVLMVAQPSLQRDLDAGMAQVQWTSTAYLLAVASLLVIAGRLGDRYGHTRMLFIGVLGFAAASAGIALAPGVGWVIALRAVQGVFGALLQPATLALLRLTYPADRLGTPVAIRTSAIGVAAAAGPVLGGVLVTHLGWRAVFWINVPVALAIAALTFAVRAPAPSRTGTQRLNLTGATLLAAALAILVHTLSGIPAHGWTTAPTWVGLAAAAGVAVAFVGHERRTAHPIVAPAVARSVPVTASVAILLVTTGGMFGALFVATFFFQDVLGLDPLASGLRALPLTALMVLGAPVAGAALGRYSPRSTAIVGTVLVILGIGGLGIGGLGVGGLGMGGLSQPASAGPGAVTGTAFAFAALGAGFATVMVTATATVVGEAPPGYAGVIGGLKQTAVNVGPALGIAVAAGMMTPRPSTAAAQAAGMAQETSASATAPTLMVLAGLAALALLPTSLLPTQSARGAGRDTAAPGTHDLHAVAEPERSAR
ncbi:MFS transporter [Streptomyces sp. NPDC056844]|uniref:MFS transporter n=1 Tax=unclassified Streptomyces TaxID=2593676 RepID=UPI0036B4D9BE